MKMPTLKPVKDSSLAIFGIILITLMGLVLLGVEGKEIALTVVGGLVGYLKGKEE